MQANLSSYGQYSTGDSELAQRAEAVTEIRQNQERDETVARLIQENQVLIAGMEHLRAVLSHKDQIIAEVRQAPQALMDELVLLRNQCEAATAHSQWVSAERDAARSELARRTLAYEQAEEELRRLRKYLRALRELDATVELEP